MLSDGLVVLMSLRRVIAVMFVGTVVVVPTARADDCTTTITHLGIINEFFDKGCDGTVDRHRVDRDGDGNWDVTVEDTDGDGFYDYMWYDRDDDGVKDNEPPLPEEIELPREKKWAVLHVKFRRN